MKSNCIIVMCFEVPFIAITKQTSGEFVTYSLIYPVESSASRQASTLQTRSQVYRIPFFRIFTLLK